MIKAFSPSELAVQALQLSIPELPVSATDCKCGLCGACLIEGSTPCTPYRPPLDFSSEQLHPRRAGLVCAHCAALLAYPDSLTKYSRAVFTPEGAYRLTTAQDVAWLLLQAPTPLLAVFNTRKSAHMIWHTPVTYDRRLIGITWGKVTGTIRTQCVQAAYEGLKVLATHYNAHSKANIPWPVDGLSLRDENLHMAQLLPSHDLMLRQCDKPHITEALEAFDKLTQCERWALSAILLTSPTPSTPWHELGQLPPPRLK